MKHIYVAHPMRARHVVKNWIEVMNPLVKVHLFNPIYETEANHIEDIDSGDAGFYGAPPEAFIPDEIRMIQTSIGLVAIITGDISYGTIMEMVYAKINDIPVYTLVLNGQWDHQWIRWHSSMIFNCLEDLNRMLEEKYGTK